MTRHHEHSRHAERRNARVVDARPDLLARGPDPQMERAVECLLKKLRTPS